MQSGFAYSRARARSFYKQQTPDKTKSINDEEELRTDVLERSLVEQKKFENFWEGIRRGVHSYYTRKIVDTNIKLEHGNTKSNTRRKNNGDAYLFHPENIYKILWDFFIGFLVMYIVIITPLQIGFDEKDTPTTLGILYFVIACFAMDMVFTFNTAYYDSKSDIMIYDRTVIIQKYLRFWFWIDLISTIPIDLIVSADSDSTTGNKLQSLRMIRFFRLFRLFRFFRVIKEAARMSSFGISPQIVNLVLLIIQIFFVAHIFACFWHFITLPQAIGSFPNNWVDTAGFTNQSVSARYVASLYYVIVTMLTVGYGDIHATNQLERFYAILTMMTGSVVFGALISKVTSLIDKTNPQAKAFAESMMEFKYFINETTLPKAMKDRAKDAYSYYMTKKSLIGESGIFDNLAKPLLNELYFDLYHDSIEKIKLFKCSDPSFVVTLLKAAKPFQALPDEVLYDEGDVCNEFIFVQKGSIRLTVSDGQKMVLIGCVLEGSYFGDAEYYKNICSIAQYSALERSDLLSVSHTAMNNALEENAMMNSIFTKYCKRRYTALTRVLRSKTKVDTRANPYVKSLSKHASSIFQRSDGVKFTSKAVLWIDGELDDHLTSMATIQSRDPVKHDSVRILRFVDGQKQFTEESPIVFEKAQLLNPHGQYKVMWDAFMAVLVFYSALIVPVEIAFSGDAFYGTGALGWAINAFFGVDIIVNFRTGYISAKDDNAIIVTPQKVAEKYLKSWFIIDLLSTIPFDAIIQSAVGYNSSSYGGLLKTFRVFRLFRLVRLFKVSNYIHEVEDFFGINPAAFNLLRLLVEVYVIIHWSSCIWWGLTSVMSDHPWFSYSGPDGFFWGTLIGDNVKLSAKYLVSTYFTLTSFTTVGYGDIYPVNTLERLLCVFMVLAGASVFGYLIANISGLLSNFSSSSASSTERIMLIREFLKERQTPKSLETKIINHFNKQFRDSSTYDVSMIVDRLPSMIGNEILYNIYNKIIDKISFFRYISMKSVQLYLFRLLKPVHHDSNHYLYKEGDYASEMIFIISGNVRIFRKEVKAEMSEVLKRAKQEQQEQLLLKSKKSTRFSVMVTDVDKEGKSDDLTRKNTATALADLVIENPTAPTSDTAASAHIEQRAERKRLIDLSIFDSIIEPEQLHEDVQQLPPRPRGGSISAPSSSKNSSSINVSSTLTAPNLLTTGSMGTRFFSKSLGNRFFSSQMGESFDDDSKHGKESDAGGATSTNNTRNLRSILRNMKQNTTMSYPNIRGGSSGSVNGDNAPTIASTTSTTGRPSSLNLNRRNLLASTKSRRQSIRRQGSASKKELEEATQNLYAALNQIKNNEKDVYSQLDCFDTPFSQLEAADFAMLHLELVGDLTTGDFLGHNAYMVNEGKHFTTARTTMPSTVYTLSQVEIARVVRIEPTVGIQLQHALTSAVIAQTKTVGKFLHSRRRGDFLKEIKMEHESKKKITSEINKNTTSGLKAISGRGRYSPLNLGDFDDSSSVHTGSIKRSIPIPPPPPPPISTPDTIDVRHANTGSSASMSRFHLGGFSSRFGLSARPAAPPSTQDSTTDALSHANIYQMNKERNFEYLFQKRNLYYDSDEEGHVDDDLTPMDQRQNSRSGRSKRTGPRGANKSNKSKKTEGKEDKGEERPKQKSPLIDFSRISPSRFLSRKKAKAEDNVTTAPAVPPTIHETLREHAGESKEKDPINTSNHSPPPNNNSNNGNNVVKLKRRDSIRDFLARSSGLHLNQTPNIKGADKYRGLKRARIVKRAFSVNDLTEKNVAHQRNLLQLLEGGKNNHSLSFTSTDATRSPEKASPRRSIAFPTSTAARTVSPRFRRNRSEDTDYGVIEEREETRKRRAEDHANQMNHQISLARRQSFPSYDYQEWKANKLNRFVL